MALTGPEVIDNAIVRRLRSSSAITTVLRGGIHERAAARSVSYPNVTYGLVSAPIITDHGTAEGTTREIRALYDVLASATNQGVAKNLAQLIDQLFSGQKAAFQALLAEQTVYYLETVGNAGVGPDRDNEGRYYVQTGRQLEIWTWQRVLPPNS